MGSYCFVTERSVDIFQKYFDNVSNKLIDTRKCSILVQASLDAYILTIAKIVLVIKN